VRRCAILLFALFALASGAAPDTWAETWPTRPVRLIVPYPPGGSNDIVGRMMALQLSDRLGKQVYIDNRAGAGSTIGAALAASAPADGYTLLLISGAFVFNPALYKQLPYDPATAFEPVAMLGSGPLALLVYPKLGVASVNDLLALARAKPGQINYATAGVGSLIHLSSELFRIQAKVDMVHVPYKGGAPAMMDVAAGQAQITMATLIQCLPLLRDGQLKPIGLSALKRTAVLPDLPTIDESGLPGYEASNWWGILAPAGTPRDIVERLHREVNEILASPETRQRFDTEGAVALPMTRAEFARYLASETEKWGRVVKVAGIIAE
jgi:tripartite-type tricarboxylate transporter receptor subunit TctC